MLRRLALLVLTLLLAAGSAAAAPGRLNDLDDPHLGRSIRAGAADPGRLWLLGESGRIVLFDRQRGRERVLDGPYQDLLRDGPRLWALQRGEAGEAARIVELTGGTDRVTPPLPGAPTRLFLTPEGPGVLTTEVVAVPGHDGWRLTRPDDRLGDRWTAPRGGPSALLAQRGRLLVGFNHGEWGGGLRAIDLATGAVSRVEDRGGSDPCGGLLNAACLPVTGAIPDPGQAGCALVSGGLAHMGLQIGRVLRVCGDHITLVYSAPVPADPRLALPGATWPFSGLAPLGDGWIASSGDQRLFIASGGTVENRPMPALHDWAGLKIADADPRFIVVMQACCWGRADDPRNFAVLVVPVL
ncbi:MAG: hypothetical protein GC145_17340 [Caulobacter sp.]|nr:hypothetical protein [Caulobacter sp.]